MAQFLKLPLKKDFGLGKHRVTLPEEENNPEDDDSSDQHDVTEPKTPETKPKANSSSPKLSQRFSSVKGRVKSLFGKSPEHQSYSSSPLLRHSPVAKEKVAHEPAVAPDLINFDEECNVGGGKQSPLHSRVVKTGHLFASEGIKGSIDSLKDQYGLTDDDDDDDDDLGIIKYYKIQIS